MDLNDKIFVAGHNGLVGSALVRQLKLAGHTNILTASRAELDLKDSMQTRWFFSVHEPKYVFLCAAKVGGIKANMKDPLGFFLDNLAIQRNVMENAHRYETKKLVFLGSSCIYPKHCPQPIREDFLLTGPLEPSNEGYALAKISGVKMCEWYRHAHGCDFVSAMPCNLYGPGDKFHVEDGHLVPGLMARMHNAKVSGAPFFEVWGDGSARRELLYSDDLARALLVVMDQYSHREPINTGSEDEVTVEQLTLLLKEVVGFTGSIVFDAGQPVGVLRKLLDNQKILNLGWRQEMKLVDGLRATYAGFLKGQ
jgi:GDP-L-fucose synthase